MTSENIAGAIFQSADGFESQLDKELGSAALSWGSLRYLVSPPERVYWAKNRWLAPFKLTFDSISQAARALRDIQRNWALVPVASHRRAALIQARLPVITRKPRPFPWVPPAAPMGAWSLLDDHSLVASPLCSSPFPGGDIEFEENKTDPPSRAYLKLYEALARLGRFPSPGERVLDAGAAPGGWSWVLAGLGARVLAVDRAPLDKTLSALENVEFIQHDAFTLLPSDLGQMDWVFSDVICYPPRLLSWVKAWLTSGLCRRFVCTIKMQGEFDRETTDAFAELGACQLIHLCYNKHELTWISAPADKEEDR